MSYWHLSLNPTDISKVKEGTKLLFNPGGSDYMYEDTVERITAHFFIMKCGFRLVKDGNRMRILK